MPHFSLKLPSEMIRKNWPRWHGGPFWPKRFQTIWSRGGLDSMDKMGKPPTKRSLVARNIIVTGP
jgi:hypothetical protein